MPSKNSRKVYLPDTFYHLYNRGIDKQDIFQDSEDYSVFLNLLKRYLSNSPAKDIKGREYPWLHDKLELLTYCLMPNHLHLLVYQIDENGIRQLLKNVCGTYTVYFNKKYKRIGPLFQDRFKAAMITNDSYLQHISRYIHLNPSDYQKWPYSSLSYYRDLKKAEWIQPDRVLSVFNSPMEYTQFLADYKDHKIVLDKLKLELADG